jgi:hypothetical protein
MTKEAEKTGAPYTFQIRMYKARRCSGCMRGGINDGARFDGQDFRRLRSGG